MLRNLAAALLATTLVAGPAFAAQQSGNTGGMAAPPATVSSDAKAAATSTQPAKHLRKHVRSHTRKHVAQGAFDFGGVVEAITAKLIRRHPHVFTGPSTRRRPCITSRAASRTKPLPPG